MSYSTKHYQSLVKLCDEDNNLVTTVIDTMALTFPEHILKIDEALPTWDTKTLQETLHLLKGSLSYLSLSKNAEQLHELESYVKQDDKDKFRQDYPVIRKFMLSLPQQLETQHKHNNT